MPQFWRKVDDRWLAQPLARAAYRFSVEFPALESGADSGAATLFLEAADPEAGAAGLSRASSAWLLRRRGNGGEEWLWLSDCASGWLINGLPLRLGTRVLRDRDEIIFAGAQISAPGYFSTERPACIEALPESLEPIYCARCRQLIEIGAAAVRCPGCDLWHHQTAELPCWTYAPKCALCEQPTALEGGFRWTPEALE
jgi:hypothetical protein